MAPALLAAAVLAPAVADFRRGVNLSHWYAQSMTGDYEERRLSTYLTADDAAKIRAMGFDHVRLTFDNRPVFDGTDEERDRFEGRVRMLLDAGLNVVVDFHPDADYKAALNDPANADRFVEAWRDLAGELAELPDDRVWFEVMNEPDGVDDWRPLQRRAVEAIREAEPDATVVVSGGGWTGADQLAAMEPYDGLDNLVYTFHYYDPHLYTHQGASWGWAVAGRTTGLPWPAEPAEADAVAEAATEDGDDEARDAARHYAATGRGTEAWAADRLDEVSQWQAEHGGPPVYVGEFGVYRPHAPRESRLAWHAAAVDLFEERGWGWAVWDYAGGFGVVEGDDRTPDAALLDALGLGQ